MTDGRRPTDWTDERLATAFRDRAAGHPTPVDLATAAVRGIAAAAPARSAPGRIALVGGLAAAAAVIAALGIGSVALGPLPTKPIEPSPSFSVLGLPVISVNDAVAVRDGEGSDRELAVAGFFAPAPAVRCAPFTGPANPIDLSCPETFTWLLEQPEQLVVGNATDRAVMPPAGPAIQPSLRLVDAGSLPTDARTTPPVVFVGHFHDRRAGLCPRERQDACGAVFLVDRIEDIHGQPVPPSTIVDLDVSQTDALHWSADEVDERLTTTFPQMAILSRIAIAGERIGEIEPGLGTGALGLIDRPIVWVVTALAPVGQNDAVTPARRTFLLVDGTDEAYIDDPAAPAGFVPLALEPLAEPPPTDSPPPSNPIGPADAPPDVLGLPVISVSDALARLDAPEIDDTELAVRGYYVPPFQPTSCPEHPPDVTPIRMACPDAFEWLMEQPEQVEDPATHERHPPRGRALNPLVADEIPFDVPDGWFDVGLRPLPVVLVGHFADRRSTSADDARRFVADALVWRDGKDADQSPVVLVAPTDSATDVQARVDAEMGPADVAWFAVVAGAKLPAIEPGAQGYGKELVASPATWIVRRLVVNDGRPRVATALVADGSDRVWSDALGDCCWLETTIDIDIGENVRLEVADYVGEILAVRPGELTGAASWVTRDGPPEIGQIQLGVRAEGPPNELRIAWNGGACDRAWRLYWGYLETLFLSPSERDPTCLPTGTRREIVLTLDHPVDIEAISVSNGGAGG